MLQLYNYELVRVTLGYNYELVLLQSRLDRDLGGRDAARREPECVRADVAAWRRRSRGLVAQGTQRP